MLEMALAVKGIYLLHGKSAERIHELKGKVIRCVKRS